MRHCFIVVKLWKHNTQPNVYQSCLGYELFGCASNRLVTVSVLQTSIKHSNIEERREHVHTVLVIAGAMSGRVVIRASVVNTKHRSMATPVACIVFEAVIEK